MANNKYTVIGGEETIISGGKRGRLMVDGGKLFYSDGKSKYSISSKDIIHICVGNDWFGIFSFNGLDFLLDARVYMPKVRHAA